MSIKCILTGTGHNYTGKVDKDSASLDFTFGRNEKGIYYDPDGTTNGDVPVTESVVTDKIQEHNQSLEAHKVLFDKKGVPAGGLTGYVLTKQSNQDNDVIWAESTGVGIAPELLIHVDTGSIITCKSGDQIITAKSVNGQASIKLEDYGSWTISATLNGKTTGTQTVVVDSVKQYNVILEYFGATITVTAEVGADVIATKGGLTVKGKCINSNKCQLKIDNAGTWNVVAKKEGISSDNKNVEVVSDKTDYPISLSFITLTVTAPEGSTIVVSKSGARYEKVGGAAKFYLPETGQWNVSASLGEDSFADVVAVSNRTNYNLTVKYFNATITVTAEDGATITATNGNLTIKETCSGSNQCQLLARKSGTWSVVAKKENCNSETKTIQVTSSGSNYPVTVNFITLTVTAPEGSSIVVSKQSKNFTRTGGTVKFYLPETGDWDVKATLNGETAQDTVAANSYKAYTLELAYLKIYGAQWDGTANTKWSRTDDAAEFVDPNPAINNGTGSSPFDNCMPWKGMVKYEDSQAGTLVAIPKFWYKWTAVGNGLKLQIADKNPKDSSFLVSPAHMDRGDGKGERDVVYIGRYHCASNNMKSHTGTTPKNNITRSDARSQIHNLGADIWQWDWHMHMTVWMLYLVEYADWNCQTAIGYGCGNSSGVENMGKSDNMKYHTGTPYSNRTTYGVGVQYRYIEGLWDNVRDWVDGCYYASNGFNIINNPAKFHDTSNGTSAGTPTGGYPSKFAVKTVNGFQVIYPIQSNGSDSTYTCDSWDWDASSPCLVLGGGYGRSLCCGLGYVNRRGVSVSSSYFGPRLQKLP